VARTALYGPDVRKPSLVRLTAARAQLEGSPIVPAEYDTSGLSLANSVHAVHRFPVDATYVVRVVLGGERPAGSEPLEVGLYLDDRRLGIERLDPEGLGSFTDDRQDFSGKTIEFRVHLPAGEHRLAGAIVRLYEGLPASYGGPSPSRRPPPPPPEFKPPK